MERPASPGMLPVTFVARDQGLAGSQVHDIAIDGASRLWLAGSTGLTLYDGTRAVNFGIRDGLRTHGLRSVAMTPNGQLWIGGDAGVDVVETDGTVHSSPRNPNEAKPIGVVDKVRARADGSIFAATPTGMLQSAGDDVWEPVSEPTVATSLISDFAVCPDEAVWAVGPQFGLMRLQGDTWSTVPQDAFEKIGKVQAVTSASSPGRVLLGGTTGIAEIDHLGRVHRALFTTVPGGVRLLHEQDETLWAAIGAHLFELQEMADRWRAVSIFLADIRVNAIVGDAVGNAWVATDESGLAKVSSLRSCVREVTSQTPGAVLSIRKNAQGHMLVGASQGSFVLRPDQPSEPTFAFQGTAVWDLLEDKHGVRWAATSDGVWRSISASEFERVGQGHQAFDSPGRACLERSDAMWVGGLAGLAYWDTEPTTVTGADGTPLGYVYTLVEDPSGRLWVGTLGNGLWVEQPAGLVKLSGQGLVDGGNTYGIAFLDDGTAMVTQDDRLVRITQDLEPSVLAQSDSPVFGWCAAIDADALWIGTNNGLAQYDIQTGELRREVSVFLGLGGWEFTTSRSILVADDGSLLCGTMHGLLAIDPAQLPDTTMRPTVALDRVSWTGTDAARLDDTLVVSPGKWTCSILVFSSWRVDEDDLEYRFRLVGFDTEWSESSAVGAIRYSSLPPGDYAFQAQAHSPLVGWGPTAELVKITVLPHAKSWQRLNTIVEAPTWVGRRLQRRAAEIDERVRARTSELEASLTELQQANRVLENETLTDPLTGMLNRRHFDAAMRSEWGRAKDRGIGLGLLMIDIDFFKWFNDDFGHQAGDGALLEIGQIISASARRATDAARWGGEEFTLIVVHEDLQMTAHEILAAVREASIWHPRGIDERVTVSIGGAKVSAEDVAKEAFGWGELVRRADAALYDAKRAGRDRLAFNP